MEDHERVTGVALFSTDMIVALPRPFRHHHLFALCALQGIQIEPCVQGFTTSRNRFVTRDVAYELAIAAEQPLRRKSGGYSGHELFSEDLW